MYFTGCILCKSSIAESTRNVWWIPVWTEFTLERSFRLDSWWRPVVRCVWGVSLALDTVQPGRCWRLMWQYVPGQWLMSFYAGSQLLELDPIGRDVLTRLWHNAGPTSPTLAQHCARAGYSCVVVSGSRGGPSFGILTRTVCQTPTTPLGQPFFCKVWCYILNCMVNCMLYPTKTRHADLMLG